jgi:DNA-binding NarL/FixJ family response regulator
MMSPTRVLLADDHDLFRAGIRSLLDHVADVKVVGEASSGREALHLIEADPPDVVLMDILMPELNGLDAAARVAAKHPDVRVIILSMNSAEEYVLQALRAGAAGYLLKTVSPNELELAIKTVSRGETFLSSAVSKSHVEDYVGRVGGHVNSLTRLTLRQREVLQLVAEGNRTKEIAKKLELSVKTIEMHRAQLMEALDIHDIPGLVRYAIRVGLITSDL